MTAPAALFDRPAWRWLIGYYRADWPALALYAAVAAAQSLLFLPTLYLVRYAFDSAIPAGRVGLLLWIGLGLLALRMANGAVLLGLRALILRIIKRAVAALRRDLLETLYGLSRQFYTDTDLDRLHTQVVQDSERVDAMSNALLSAMLPAVCTSVTLGLLLIWLNWWLLALAATVLPLVWLAGRLTGRRVKQRVHVFQRAFEAYSKGIQFVLRHIDLTRIQSFEDGELRRQNGLVQQLRHTGEGMAMSYAMHNQVQSNVSGLAGLVILIAGGIAIARHDMSLGEFLAFYIAAGLLNGFVERIGNALPELIAGNESLLTLRRLCDAGPKLPYHGTGKVGFTGRIELRNAAFRYGERMVLRDVSLQLAPGANIAIIGPNGAGKTTVFNLIIGFSRPDSGTILAEGIPYDTLDLRALRRGIGVVTQHPAFFSGTIAENIGYGHTDIDRVAIVTASQRACADDFISALPQGYDTEIGEGGVRLSGGEVQRLAIARALVGRPRLLILDEPTSHIDLETMRRLMDRLVDDPARPALLTISHDAEVVRFADTVYRLADGMLLPARIGAAA